MWNCIGTNGETKGIIIWTLLPQSCFCCVATKIVVQLQYPLSAPVSSGGLRFVVVVVIAGTARYCFVRPRSLKVGCPGLSSMQCKTHHAC